MDIFDKYYPEIGLEVHARMNTVSKTFCSCRNVFGLFPNMNTCPVCLGHPGTLPVMNKILTDFVISIGISANCMVNSESSFERKNYFYPDLPKGYQITQYSKPFCYDGYFEIITADGNKKRIGISRINIEEDAGKSVHNVLGNDSCVDFNRCGTPLIEIVSEPDMSTLEEVRLFIAEIKHTLSYLNICDCNMEKGSLRFDANISLREKDKHRCKTRSEIKNLNSIKNILDSIRLEIKNQYGCIKQNKKIRHSTLSYNSHNRQLTSIRSKEALKDYRYFPEPDLPNIYKNENSLNELSHILPELRNTMENRFIDEYQLNKNIVQILIYDKSIAEYFESVVFNLKYKNYNTIKLSANLIINEILKILNENHINIFEFKIIPEYISYLIDNLSVGKINSSISRYCIYNMLETNRTPGEIITEYSEKQNNIPEIRKLINKVLSEYPSEVQRFYNGELKLINFFIGKIRSGSSNNINPNLLRSLLIDILKK